jgi:hypothetical protein
VSTIFSSLYKLTMSHFSVMRDRVTILSATMSRGRSPSPRHPDQPNDGSDAEMRSVSPPSRDDKGGTSLKVVVITNLTRNVVESHLRTIFGFYGEIKKIDLPLYGKCVLIDSVCIPLCSYSVYSRSKSRESSSGILRAYRSSEGGIIHEQRPTGRCDT